MSGEITIVYPDEPYTRCRCCTEPATYSVRIKEDDDLAWTALNLCDRHFGQLHRKAGRARAHKR